MIDEMIPSIPQQPAPVTADRQLVLVLVLVLAPDTPRGTTALRCVVEIPRDESTAPVRPSATHERVVS